MGSDAACGHPDPAGAESVCEHILLHPKTPLGCYRWYPGRGMDSEVLCDDCTGQRELGRTVTTSRICKACLDSFLGDVGDLKGVKGSPEIREKLVPIKGESMVLSTAFDIVDVDPIAGAPHSWLGLDSTGVVVAIDTKIPTIRAVAHVAPIPEPDHKPWCGHQLLHRIHASHDGEYIAIVNDYGRRGLVAEIATGRITMALDGGEYFPETVPFSLCFCSHHGRSVLVHRTKWNRLDVSDPATGHLLSDRSPTSYKAGEPRPAHYLDYFHGRIYPSPNGKKLLDDGWVWHPVGGPTTWSLESWLGKNVWESEDGPTRRELCWREYYWDHGMCWLDENRIALGGLGNDDILIVPGARVFEASDGACREICAFAGPSGSFFSDGSRLFSSDDSGLSVWDVAQGVRTGHLAGVKPQRLHPMSHEFMEIGPDGVVVWRIGAG